jgi:hypothetical protein
MNSAYSPNEKTRMSDLLSDVHNVAKLIISREKGNFERAIDQVAKNPMLLRYKTKIIDEDNRINEGTPFQIAAIRGLVGFDLTVMGIFMSRTCNGLDPQCVIGRLIQNSDLSPQEVHEQLSVVTSKEAKEESNKRNQYLFNLMKDFGEAIFENRFNADNQLNEFKKYASPLILQLNNDLKKEQEKPIQLGRASDPMVLHHVIEWVASKESYWRSFYNEETSSKIMSYKLKLFFIQYGQLQNSLTPRDKEAFYRGIPAFLKDRGFYSREPFEKKLPFSIRQGLGIDYALSYTGKIIEEYHFEKMLSQEQPWRCELDGFNGIKNFCEATEKRFIEFSEFFMQQVNELKVEKKLLVSDKNKHLKDEKRKEAISLSRELNEEQQNKEPILPHVQKKIEQPPKEKKSLVKVASAPSLLKLRNEQNNPSKKRFSESRQLLFSPIKAPDNNDNNKETAQDELSMLFCHFL